MAADRRNLQIVITEAGHGKPLYKGEIPSQIGNLDITIPVSDDTNVVGLIQYLTCMSQGVSLVTANGNITTAYGGAS